MPATRTGWPLMSRSKLLAGLAVVVALAGGLVASGYRADIDRAQVAARWAPAEARGVEIASGRVNYLDIGEGPAIVLHSPSWERPSRSAALKRFGGSLMADALGCATGCGGFRPDYSHSKAGASALVARDPRGNGGVRGAGRLFANRSAS